MFGQALERTGIEQRVDVGVGEAVVGRLEFIEFRALLPFERIQIGPARTERAVSADHLQYADLLLVIDRSRRCRAIAAGLGLFGKGMDDRQVRYVVRRGARQLCQFLEVFAPFAGNRGRIAEIVLVKLLDKGGVAAEQKGVSK